MNPLLLARAGLMGLGRLPGFLFRGTGWRRGAKGVEDVVRAARPQQTSRFTPVQPLREPVVNPYMRGVPTSRLESPLIRRYGRTSRDQFRGVPGVTTGGTRGAPTITYARQPAVTRQLPAGYARRKPVRAAGLGIAGAGAAALGTYPFIAGDEEPPIDPNLLMTPPEPWAAPEGVLDFAEAEAARAERGEKNIQDMLTKGFLIAAAGGDPSKFFDRGLEVLKASEQYKVDKDYAKVVRAVYKKGDMPKNARDAYERLAPLVGPEKAAVLSGHQLGMEPGKTKEERAWRRIEEIALMGDIDGAAAELVAAWNTGRLKNPAPHITIYSAQLAKAKETLSGIISGGAGFAEGVQNIRAASA